MPGTVSKGAPSITAGVYERHRDKLQEEIALAELELHDARIDAIDVTGLLAFAEQLLSNLGTMWIEASKTADPGLCVSRWAEL